ncbi:hypothetical protein WOC76_12700 [Methylocystis sp. IM3]|jgi:hypothetical protein|uniref:hypothetical protein n=1 Tax=unclassified Methylocystis TaxID=2625913 RepID=UPI000FC34547|nr:MAG: hypothetical protein EKK29_05790 [Hyphomicrobiales bacterium]
MRYWLIPVLVCVGAAQAHAGSFIGANINNPIVSVKGGVSVGPSNSDTANQNSFVNAYAVQNLAVGGNSPSNNTNVTQKGFANAYAGQNIAISNGAPGGNPSNNTTVKQKGVVNYVGLGQHIQSAPLMPMGGP